MKKEVIISEFSGYCYGVERVMDLVDLKIKPLGKPGEDTFSYSLTVDTYYQPN